MPCGIHEYIDRTNEPTTTETNIPVAEIFVIAGVLTLWFVAVLTFFKQWRSLRMLEPRESRFSHLPHNLGMVKVVKKHRDSVIYKNYPENWCRTIEARQRRLERMRAKVKLTLCTDGDPYCSQGLGIPMAPVRDLAASCSMIMASVQSEDLGGVVKNNFEQLLPQPIVHSMRFPSPQRSPHLERRSPLPSRSSPLLMETHL